jgi:AcrR family transcriptional regulator
MEDSRDVFLKTGIELLAQGESSTSLSLRMVAKKAGFSHNALYRHYTTKEVYLDALTAYGFTLLCSRFEACRTKKAALDAYYQFAIEVPELYELMFLSVKTPKQILRRESGMHTLGIFIEKLGLDINNKSEYKEGASTWIALHGYIMVEKSGMLPRDKTDKKLIDYASFIKMKGTPFFAHRF